MFEDSRVTNIHCWHAAVFFGRSVRAHRRGDGHLNYGPSRDGDDVLAPPPWMCSVRCSEEGSTYMNDRSWVHPQGTERWISVDRASLPLQKGKTDRSCDVLVATLWAGATANACTDSTMPMRCR